MTERAMRRILQFLPAALVFLLICAAAPALAAQGDESPADTTLGWIFRWLNFLIVFGGIAYLAAKRGPAFFRRRAEAIVSAITESARVKEEAERQRREAEEKLAGLAQEISELRATSGRDAAAEADRLRALAREDVKKIDQAAQAEIRAAERAARMELKAAGARLAVERAEALLRREISAQSEATFFRVFLADLERSAN